VLAGDFPGRLRFNMDWIMFLSRGILGGQPSMTTPTPFPWDSPHVVIFNNAPNVFPGIFASLLFHFEKAGALIQVRDALIFISDLCLKSQIPSTKLQIKHKFQ
jgi:hypothetical protein